MAPTQDISPAESDDSAQEETFFSAVKDGESSTDESSDLGEEVPGKKKITRRKQEDYAAFDTFVEANGDRLFDSAANGPGNRVDDLLNDGRRQERIISKTRDYQTQLFERAKEQNTIVVLDTGTGKTLIAALLLRDYLERELEDRAAGKPKRLAFFLVDKVSLVFQQYDFLTCNLDFPVQKICGDMVDALWDDKEFWARQFSEFMAIVCTAEILQRCLVFSYLSMKDINLLVFDEAHHAKKNHSYARIMKDFYWKDIDTEKVRPRILGMTASPVDADEDVEIAASELEALLNSHIATFVGSSSEGPLYKPAKDKIVSFARAPAPFETDLCRALRPLIYEEQTFKRTIAFSKFAAAELGTWCADRAWTRFSSDAGLARLEARQERALLRNGSEGDADVFDAHKENIARALELIKANDSLPLQFCEPFLSQKVICLVNTLQQYFSTANSTRCIIFVQQRYTAIVLADLLQQPGLSLDHVRSGVFTGGGLKYSETSMSLRQSKIAIAKFRRGDINCLVATSVAEEGLDIPDCNLVIRFDFFTTMIQYIQSRGRARQPNSEYILMAEYGNAHHISKLLTNAQNEDKLRRFCAALPENRKLKPSDHNLEYALSKEREHRSHTLPTTKATLSYYTSMSVLGEFVASLPHRGELPPSAEYHVRPSGRSFVCEITMPESSPVSNAVGLEQATKQGAKCSAAFDMCMQLVKKGFLNGNLRSTFAKRLPAMRNARLALSSKKRGKYKMLVKPEFWKACGTDGKLFVTLITMDNYATFGRPCWPILLLTRKEVPEIADIPLFFGKAKRTLATLHCYGQVEVDASHLEALKVFTLRAFWDVFSKDYDAGASDLPYLLAPARCTSAPVCRTGEEILKLIDWDCISTIQANESLPWEHEDDNFFEGRFVSDPFDGARKLWVRRVRRDIKQTDAEPENAPKLRTRGSRGTSLSIEQYSLNLWGKSRRAYEFKPDQPVLETELVSLRRNFLDDFVEEEVVKVCYVVPQPLNVSAIPGNIVAMLYIFPALLHRLESNLVALEACEGLGLGGIRPHLALEAMTKDSDNTDDGGEEQINFQGGMGRNYERLEFLGDCFLKMATTIALFIHLPDADEYESHVERMLLVCNKNLFNSALDLKLEQSVRSKSFNRQTWYPEGLVLKRGRKTESGATHTLGDKSVADVCEALIGAAYMTSRAESPSGDANAMDLDMAVKAVTVFVRHKHHDMERFADYLAAYSPPAWLAQRPNAVQLHLAEQVRLRLGYRFANPRLLRSAFLHPTYGSLALEGVPHYQRLEFLGDSLLDMAAVDYLFARFPDADPQQLTEHKTAVVANAFLAALAVELGFHRHLALGLGPLRDNVVGFVAELTAARDEALGVSVVPGSDAGVGAELEPLPSSLHRHHHQHNSAAAHYFLHPDPARRPRGDYWLAVESSAPKALADCVEAFVGALFVDAAHDMATVHAFFADHVAWHFADMALYDAFAARHPVSLVGRTLTTQMGCARWRFVVREMPAEGAGAMAAAGGGTAVVAEAKVVAGLVVHGKVWLSAVAGSGRYAKMAAAKKAMGRLWPRPAVEGLVVAATAAGGGGGGGKTEGTGGAGGAEEAAARLRQPTELQRHEIQALLDGDNRVADDVRARWLVEVGCDCAARRARGEMDGDDGEDEARAAGKGKLTATHGERRGSTSSVDSVGTETAADDGAEP